LSNKDKQPEEVLNKETDSVEVNPSQNKMPPLETISNERSGQPMSIKEIIDANRDRIIIASVSKPKDNEDTSDVKKKVSKGIKM
jgi:rRNA pseudouridine-1189 N-methylase Emg1 (Nep1/Mra1 family)